MLCCSPITFHPVPAAIYVHGPQVGHFVTLGPSQLLIGHVLLFQDRSLRPEEIEGKTWPLRGKGYSAIQEAEGTEVGGKRGREPLASEGRAWYGVGHSLWGKGLEECTVLGSSRAWLSGLVGPMAAFGPRGLAGPTPNHVHLCSLPQSSERPSENLTKTRMATSTAGTWATACAPWATCPLRWSLLSCPSRST